MLNFLVFLGFFIVFALPIISLGIRSTRQRINTSSWVMATAWLLLGIFLYIAMNIVLDLWIDWNWFHEVGFTSVFWTAYLADWKYFLIFGFTTLAFFALNSAFARGSSDNENTNADFKIMNLAFQIVAILTGFITALAMKSYWPEFLRFTNQVPFGTTDPVFHHDLAFYVFSMPVYELMSSFLTLMVFIAMIYAGISYGVQMSYYIKPNNNYGYYDRRSSSRTDDNPTGDERNYHHILNRLISHLSILGVLLMGVFIFGTQIAKWDILFSERGAVFGAGYTDINVQLGAYNFFIGALIVAAIALIVSAIADRLRTTIIASIVGFGTCFLVWLIAIVIVPAWVQNFSVEPNELTKETPYITRNIKFTRQAYGLDEDHVMKSTFKVNNVVDDTLVPDNINTLSNVRLWDWKALQATNYQNQALRLYYTFPDVDVVRYNINGKPVQMMYSGRELDQNKLDDQAKTWLNLHLIYTHGYGGCANPVNTFLEPDGLPDYWVKNIPVESRYPELHVDEPRIYYGEATDEYVYVKTTQKEFDYPKGSSANAMYTYKGKGGFPVGAGFRRLALAMRYDDFRLLNSDKITAESRIMLHRNIVERVQKIAPFLSYDGDPYQVIANGKIWYIWDAYTSTDHFPYSQPTTHGESRINYIRNSVKIVIDAFNGSVQFYVFEPNDPVIRTYQRIFPELFTPASKMPASLRVHVRYPEDLLLVQSSVYRRYHMDNINVFYNKEDTWDIANQSGIDGSSRINPYFVNMVVPGEKKSEFVIVLPFTPRNTTDNPKYNLVGWLAGRCDGEHYGKLITYEFPKGTLINGPQYIGTKIQQDSELSKTMTLWNQQGSKVEWGKLLVIPLVGRQLLYVQPVFLQATSGKMPELKIVVLSLNGNSNRLVYGETFDEALSKLVGGGNLTLTTTLGSNKPDSPGKTTPQTNNQLIKEATKSLNNYQTLTGQGKFTEAGKEMDKVKHVLNQLLNR